jgi:hypothetical protein
MIFFQPIVQHYKQPDLRPAGLLTPSQKTLPVSLQGFGLDERTFTDIPDVLITECMKIMPDPDLPGKEKSLLFPVNHFVGQ